MQITFEGDTALSLVQQMQQYITDTSVGQFTASAAITSVQQFTDHAVTIPAPVATEQPEVPGQPDASGLDKAGFPWDARIHSGGKSMNADGTWRYKKGADKAVIQSIEAELSSRLNGTPVAAPPVPTPVAAPPAPAPVAVGGATPATIVNLISTLKLDVPTAVLPVLNNFGLNTLLELFQPQAAPMLGAIYAALGGQ